MPYILSYTKKGEGVYNFISDYPLPETPLNCDWEHSMHLAYSEDGNEYIPLRNNTGILFPKCAYDEGNTMGVTKTLVDPFIFRMKDGGFAVAAVRRGQNEPDMTTIGSMMLFISPDLVSYEESGFLKLAQKEIRNPRCRYDESSDSYYVEWNVDKELFCGNTKDFKNIINVKKCNASLFEDISNVDYNIKDAVVSGIIEVTCEELKTIKKYFDVIYNTGVNPITIVLNKGDKLDFEKLPKAEFIYSDDSVHFKNVKWNKEQFDKIDFSNVGEYIISGEVMQKNWPFPMELGYGENEKYRGNGMSDPCMTFYNGKYYLTSSGGNPMRIRVGNTIEEAFKAVPVEVKINWDEEDNLGTWAAELHIIEEKPYIFTAFCSQKGQYVRAYVIPVDGDPAVADNWGEPKLCVKADGSVLTEGGISLDMTYFNINDVHYVMWSDRIVPSGNLDFSNADPANIFIAEINPKEPWKCVSEPVCVLMPTYGFDRYGTNVDEGPYILEHGDDIFITISGSSTGVPDLYNLGFLKSKKGLDLLKKDSWKFIPYPFLTKESVENQFGPGHNNFIKDPDSGDDLMVYHAVPHDENGKSMGRKAGVRRVHWASTGLPYLEMTEDRDVDINNKVVNMKIIIT